MFRRRRGGGVEYELVQPLCRTEASGPCADYEDVDIAGDVCQLGTQCGESEGKYVSVLIVYCAGTCGAVVDSDVVDSDVVVVVVIIDNNGGVGGGLHTAR